MTYDFRLVGRLNFAGFNFFPVDPPEECVSPDIFLATVAASQSLVGQFIQKLQNKSILLVIYQQLH